MKKFRTAEVLQNLSHLQEKSQLQQLVLALTTKECTRLLKTPIKQYRPPPNFPWQSWNCHQWVGDALENLRVELCLPAEVIRAALDAMANAIVEAKD